jgi:hypothetical protein
MRDREREQLIQVSFIWTNKHSQWENKVQFEENKECNSVDLNQLQ